MKRQEPILTFKWAKIGIRKAAVFPDPVGAQANISRPYKTLISSQPRHHMTKNSRISPPYLQEQWNGLHLNGGGVFVTNSSNVPSNVCWQSVTEREMGDTNDGSVRASNADRKKYLLNNSEKLPQASGMSDPVTLVW